MFEVKFGGGDTTERSRGRVVLWSMDGKLKLGVASFCACRIGEVEGEASFYAQSRFTPLIYMKRIY